MIFVTTGTNGAPFDRLLRGVAALNVPEELVVQRGPSTTPLPHATSLSFIPFETLVRYVRSARSVICHGGVGSILVALMNGHTPLVVPRLARFGEAVDDHQLTLARRLHAEGLVVLVEDVDRLSSILATTSQSAARRKSVEGGLLLEELSGRVRALARTS